MRFLRYMSAVAVAGMVVLAAGRVAGGGDCGKATEEARRAQADLSKAVRDCDAAASVYFDCMSKNGQRAAACSAQKRAHVAAMDRKRQAQDTYRQAQDRQRQACR
jgi:hypothetical protein